MAQKMTSNYDRMEYVHTIGPYQPIIVQYQNYEQIRTVFSSI